MNILYRKSDGLILEKGGTFSGVKSSFGVVSVPTPEDIDTITNLSEIDGIEDILRTSLRDSIDLKTDALFLTTTFTYNDVEFPVKKENQFDYKTVVDECRAGFIEYPFKIKGVGSTYYFLTNLDDANAFFLASLTVVQTLLQTGWALKDSLAEMTLEQLMNFEDPR